jgi:hypothetical protein
METELQAQIPGLDHVVSEYSVVSATKHHVKRDQKYMLTENIGLFDACLERLRRGCRYEFTFTTV